MLPVATEGLAQQWIVGFLQALWLLVESRKVPLDHPLHTRECIVLLYRSVSTNKRPLIDSAKISNKSIALYECFKLGNYNIYSQRQKVRVVVRVGEFLEERAWLEDEGW